jgi:molybdopterin molybdotransferase
VTSSTGTSVDWNQARQLAHRPALPARAVPLVAAIGCVLAENLVAGTDLPAADTSAMDGWAVSGPPPWTVVGQSLAGRSPEQAVALRPSQAVVIATGAVIPAGATGIVRSEHGLLGGPDGAGGPDGPDSPDGRDGCLLRLRDEVPGPPDLSDVRPRGHEARAGEVLIGAGARVRPPTAGLAAAAGHDTLRVHPRPTVTVLVLGDELLDSGRPRAGVVRDALGVQLPAWVSALGGEPVGMLRVPDDPDATVSAVQAAASRSDVVVTTGGSAGGAADHVRRTLAALDARIAVDTVDVRPGHPMLLAELPGGGWLIGLPGNPLAALAGVVTLLAPLLAGLGGAVLPQLGQALVEDDVPIVPYGRRPRGHLLTPVARTPTGVRPTGYAASAMLRGVALADGFLVVPPDGLPAGAPGTVCWFPWTSATAS